MPTYNPGSNFGPGSGYGPRTGPNGNFHRGMDYPAPEGTPIPSAGGGTVYYLGTGAGFGNVVIIDHGLNSDGNHVFSVYAHLQSLPTNLHPNDPISAGQTIGNVGHTGVATNGTTYGNHLHFEVLSIEPGNRLPTPGGGSSTGARGINREDPANFDAWPTNNSDPANPPPQDPISPDWADSYINFGSDLGSSINQIEQSVADLISAAMRFVNRRDPLTLDLNNNGLETLPINATNPVYFDLTGEGVQSSVGWVAPSDGFLALDRNGDGLINDGTELFGDATPAYEAGTTTPTTGKTADGFEALAQEDTNADGVVNAQDANFANLRVWQDANQDGISQAG